MKRAKWTIFGCSMIIMILLLIVEIHLNLEWYQMEKEYEGAVQFYLTAPSMEMENRIFGIDMALAAIGFVNIVAIVAYLALNYQTLVDRWRRFRGSKSSTMGYPKDNTRAS
ncbi:MAG: hypothetical protein GY751_02485 [Bacteroidetes bacterium]|nr:hypothetical protein [Bacteroidota bacterium]